jgi:hypothetical protein
MAKQLNVILDDDDHRKLLKAKGEQSWRDDPCKEVMVVLMNIQEISITLIVEDELQPRQQFDDIFELRESIKRHGLIYPLEVERMHDGKYLLLDGARRFRALCGARDTLSRQARGGQKSDFIREKSGELATI